MTLRSMLFVPGDSERKLAKAASSGADALILDLEDSVAPTRTAAARGLVLEYLQNHANRSQQLWVRINPLDTPAALLDLMVVAGRPCGVMVPKVNSGADVVQLTHYLAALEVREGVPLGNTKVLPVASETAASMFSLGSYTQCGPRLAGITWGAEDLAAALGASSNRRRDGEYDTIYQLARALCLAGASAASVQAIDTIWANFADLDGLAQDAADARRAGFTGKMAIHPGQVAVINAAFTPTEAELAWSRRVVQVFADNPGMGTVGLEGKMLDMPHLKQARRVLGSEERS